MNSDIDFEELAKEYDGIMVWMYRSHDGLFQGFLVIGIGDTKSLDNLLAKIKNIKGVKDVQRSN